MVVDLSGTERGSGGARGQSLARATSAAVPDKELSRERGRKVGHVLPEAHP